MKLIRFDVSPELITQFLQQKEHIAFKITKNRLPKDAKFYIVIYRQYPYAVVQLFFESNEGQELIEGQSLESIESRPPQFQIKKESQ